MIYKPIGIIHSPFKVQVIPNRPLSEKTRKTRGEVEVFGEYEEGLKDIGDFPISYRYTVLTEQERGLGRKALHAQ